MKSPLTFDRHNYYYEVRNSDSLMEALVVKRNVEAWNHLRKSDPEYVPDLSEADLEDVDLSGADLRQANLHGGYFNRANFTGADLREADLRHAHLVEADFSGADLTRADLRGAHVTGVKLERAVVAGTIFDPANR